MKSAGWRRIITQTCHTAIKRGEKVRIGTAHTGSGACARTAQRFGRR